MADVEIRSEELPSISIKRKGQVVGTVIMNGPLCATFFNASAEAFGETEVRLGEMKEKVLMQTWDPEAMVKAVDTILPEDLKGGLGMREYREIFINACEIVMEEFGYKADDNEKKSNGSSE